MASRVLGATCALLAALLLIASLVSPKITAKVPAWWDGAPVINGKERTQQSVHVGPFGAAGCNNRGCEALPRVGGKAVGMAAGVLIAIEVLLAVLVALATWRFGDARKKLAAVQLALAVMIVGLAAYRLSLGAQLSAEVTVGGELTAIDVGVPIGAGVYMFGVAIAALVASSFFTFATRAQPLRLKTPRGRGMPVPPPPDVRDIVRERHDSLRPSGPHAPSRPSAPLFDAAPQLRPLYEMQGSMPEPVQPVMPTSMPTPIPRAQVSAIAGIPTPPPVDIDSVLPPGGRGQSPVSPYAATAPSFAAPVDPRAKTPSVAPPVPFADARGRSPSVAPPPGGPRAKSPSVAPPAPRKATLPPPTPQPAGEGRARSSTVPPPTPADARPKSSTLPPPPPADARPKSPTVPPRPKSPTLPPASARTKAASIPPPAVPGVPAKRLTLSTPVPPMPVRADTDVDPSLLDADSIKPTAAITAASAPAAASAPSAPPPSAPPPTKDKEPITSVEIDAAAKAAHRAEVERIRQQGARVAAAEEARRRDADLARIAEARRAESKQASPGDAPPSARAKTPSAAERQPSDSMREAAVVGWTSEARDLIADEVGASQPDPDLGDCTDQTAGDVVDARGVHVSGDVASDQDLGGDTPIVDPVPPPSALGTPPRAASAPAPRPIAPAPKIPITTAPGSLPPPKVAEVPQGPTPACPQCEAPMAWVEEHLRFYCKMCRMYF